MQPACVQCFTFAFFLVLVFSVFFSVHVSLDFLFVFFSTAVTSPFPHYRRVACLGLSLISTDLWSQRRSRDAHGTPRTSHLGVQNATARPPRIISLAQLIHCVL